MTIEQRLDRLETQNKRLRIGCCALVAILISGCVAGVRAARPEATAAQEPTASDVIRARRVEVVDSQGRVIVALAQNTLSTGGVVFVKNTSGALVAQMGAASDGRGVVWAYTPQGVQRDSFR